MDERRIHVDSKVGTRVRVCTPAGGCYNGKTGIIIEVLNRSMEPCGANKTNMPYMDTPYWYRVSFDSPAHNGGKAVYSEIFQVNELFHENYGGSYWDLG